MITVLWEFDVAGKLSREEIEAAIEAAAPDYVGVPGLIRKTFGVSKDGGSVVGIYLWRSTEDADALYTPEWIARVEARWRSKGVRRDWDAPAVVESLSGEVVT